MPQLAIQALLFLPFVLPICLWVAWNDCKYMKIPNKAVLALVGVFLVVGLVAVPLAEYPWRLLQGVIVLAVGFFLNMARALGAGDAKFAAAMALFIPMDEAGFFLRLFASALLAAFIIHRSARALPAFRAQTADWVSWVRSDFPMGLALGPALGIFLIMQVL